MSLMKLPRIHHRHRRPHPGAWATIHRRRSSRPLGARYPEARDEHFRRTERRDLAADLRTCEAATPGPWKRRPKKLHMVTDAVYNPVAFCRHFRGKAIEDATMIAEARTGWPAAIRRAMAAEAEIVDLKAVWLPCDQTVQCAICGWIDWEDDAPHPTECPVGHLQSRALAAEARVEELEDEVRDRWLEAKWND